MSKKLTQKEFEERMNKINPNIKIKSNYITSKTKVICKCKICKYEWKAKPNNLLMGKGCPMCSGNAPYTQESFVAKLSIINSNIEILSKYINNHTKIHCKCKIDGYEWNPVPSSLLLGTGCPVCSNKAVMIGINDMWTTNPELAKLLANPEDGYKYTQCSNQYVDWKCPNCGEIIKNKMINHVYSNGLCCLNCSDGISYPEKFMYNFLHQLNVEFKYQYSPRWCKYEFEGKQKTGRYDFYIPSINCIIETHGLQHYQERETSSVFRDTLQKVQENDSFKKQLAIDNGIKENNYIVVDCRHSDLEWIKNSILSSKLTMLFDLSKIKWKECGIFACDSIIKTICNYSKDNSSICIEDIATKYQLSISAIRKYLRRGTVLGWCNYNKYIKHNK